MKKTILITGATDGIGLATAKRLVSEGHQIILHGRNPSKLAEVANSLSGGQPIESYVADFSVLADVDALAGAVIEKHSQLDALVNNAGVFKIKNPVTDDGLDARFVVNTLAPYLLTQRLLPLLGTSGRVINLSSAAQAPVSLDALGGQTRLQDMQAYAQSKLALTMWTRHLADSLRGDGPVLVAVNPGSLLATKMVREGFGVSGNDLGIGADILVRAALSDEFANVSGLYFDNDSGRFASPHPDALDPQKCEALVRVIETILDRISS